MEKDKKLISLKEASELSGYSSDYIGQLIRSGKIFGEQVYTGVVWMTTEDEVLSYKNKSKQKSVNKTKISNGFFASLKKKLSIELSIFKIFFKTFKSAFILLFILILLIVFLFSYILFTINKTTKPSRELNNVGEVLENLRF